MSFFANEDRWLLIRSAADYLDRFLNDIITDGIGSDLVMWTEQLEGLAARMVDYKCGGVARRIRLLIEAIEKGDRDWPEASAKLCGQLAVFSKKIISTPDDQLDTIAEWLIWSGWSISQKQIMHRKPINDDWIVLGHTRQKEEKLRVHRTWLYGQQTRRFGQHIEFLIGFNKPSVYWNVGKIYNADFIFYPGQFNWRVLVHKVNSEAFAKWPKQSGYTIEKVKDYTSKIMAGFPLIDSIPVLLSSCSLKFNDHKQIEVFDDTGLLPNVSVDPAYYSQLMALSGEGDIAVFGDLTEGQLFIHTVGFEGEVHRLT